MDLTTNRSGNTQPQPQLSITVFSSFHNLATKEMPIASGAAGRVNVGVDTSKRWAPDGVRARPVIRQHDSYLLRYQELKEVEKKNNLLESTQGGRDPTDLKNNGVQKNNSEDNTSGKASGGKTSKTSKLCVIL